LLEINHQFLNHYPDTNLNIIYLMLYTTAFVWLFDLLVLKRAVAAIQPVIRVGIITAAIAVYQALFPAVFEAESLMLERQGLAGVHFLAHWGSAVFIGLLFYRLIVLLKEESIMPVVARWICCAGIVWFLSMEVSLLSNWLFTSPVYPFERVETIYIKTALPVLWGLLSFAMMWLGMRYKERTLRVISLSLFTLTLAKLFIFDIRDIPAAGKIAAFMCLGILLLIISFMYQKVKKIIVADETYKQDN